MKKIYFKNDIEHFKQKLNEVSEKLEKKIRKMQRNKWKAEFFFYLKKNFEKI